MRPWQFSDALFGIKKSRRRTTALSYNGKSDNQAKREITVRKRTARMSTDALLGIEKSRRSTTGF
ncbi:MAG: hypothetical protein EWV81_16095 [Microcystis aeruginosa Ma_SC_T_19800800_S464]|uniref:Uncharacterized protein n=1 Tax=Microcystis aeruginosa Ma_SC_T_19800800_S464 TaxID=2486257 RepID=A0A552DMN7_MICAE|nr:MAG: hypothetical protein EWV81_16095 [Microcystis aeruginosa Ma_SC_T_19800800_S464]